MRKHHKEDSSIWEISFGKSSVRGCIPVWKYAFFIDDKGGEIYQMQRQMLGEREQRHGFRGSDGHRGSMSDMTSVLHQSVVINAQRGYC
jgi:hypothetical protein